MGSIRRTLNVRLLVGTSVLMLGAGLLLSYLFRTQMEGEIDASLLASARSFITLTEEDPESHKVALDPAALDGPQFQKGEHPDYFQFWIDGKFGLRSPSLAKNDLPHDGTPSDAPRYARCTLPDGRPGRFVQVDFAPRVDLDPDDEPVAEPTPSAPASPADQGGEKEDDDENETRTPVSATPSEGDGAGTTGAGTTGAATPPRSKHLLTLVVARGVESIAAPLRAFHLALLISGLALLVTMTLLVQTSIRAAVHPIDVLGRRVEALSATSLSTRLDRNVPKELRPLVEQLNGLLARLEEAFRRERQLTSDVAHELRTPVAELRSIAEVGGRWPESRDEVVAFFKDVHDVAMHMERLIADLLALARYEGGLEAIRWEPVVLLEELGEVRAHLEGRAVQRNVAIVVEGEGPAEVWTDRAKLEVILRNLLQNAIEHSPQGSTVRCRIIAEPGSARLVVANPAPALEPQDLPRMFDRFWRKEASRTGESNAGLGLALVRAFADLLGLDVRPTLGGDHTLSMMVTFSSRRPEPAAAPA